MAKNKDGAKTVIIRREAEGGHQGHHGGSWKVAYADFVTAMMALFLLLWLIAALKPQQKAALSSVFKDAPAKGAPTAPPPTPMILIKNLAKGYPEFNLSQRDKQKYEIALLIKELITSDPAVKSNAGISSDEAGALLQINNAVMFEPNSATLTPKAREVIDQVVKILQDHKVDMVVRGHADDKEGGPGTAARWTLSSARAAAVVAQLVERGISPSRLSAVGFGDSRPLAPPTSDENRLKNRRVEFLYASPDLGR